MGASGDTRIIQIILLAAVVVLTIMLTRSTAGSRHQAIRRLGLLAFVALAAVSVLFPSWVSSVARLVGVGRGTDLVLYVLVVMFFGYVVVTARGHARRDRQTTVLARRLALREADDDARRAGHRAAGASPGDGASADDGAPPAPPTAPPAGSAAPGTPGPAAPTGPDGPAEEGGPTRDVHHTDD